MDAEKKIRVHVFVTGKVQGVYFRQNTKQVAARHGVVGWVRNLNDGRVEALFEGEQANVSEVVEWCHVGPPKAHVDHVNVKFEKYSGEFVDFDVSY